MKAIVCDRWGEPEEVLQVRDVAEPTPGRGQVRVRMLASPINPSDLLMVRGQYGRQPPLPATPGFEGVGIVESGSGLLARRVMGRRVAVLGSGGGNWQEHVVIPARQAVPLPKELSDEQAATFFVNPASALILTRYVLQVPPGAWLLQTAAGSTLGRMVIRLGQHFGFRTLNVVRRREQAEELLRLGGTAAIATNDESLAERVPALTGGAGSAIRPRCRWRGHGVRGGARAGPRRPDDRLRHLGRRTVARRSAHADGRSETHRRILVVGVGARSEAVDDAVAVSANRQADAGRRAGFGHWQELRADGHSCRRASGGVAGTTGKGASAHGKLLRPGWKQRSC